MPEGVEVEALAESGSLGSIVLVAYVEILLMPQDGMLIEDIVLCP